LCGGQTQAHGGSLKRFENIPHSRQETALRKRAEDVVRSALQLTLACSSTPLALGNHD
jgi:hypothetical protein